MTKKYPPSYHDRVQGLAREVEFQRGKAYGHVKVEISEPKYTLKQWVYLLGGAYKLLRVMASTKTADKQLDDSLDAYNYSALFFEDIAKANPEEFTKFAAKTLGINVEDYIAQTTKKSRKK